MFWIFIGLLSLYLVIKDGIRRDTERRKLIPDTEEWVRESLQPGAGLDGPRHGRLLN